VLARHEQGAGFMADGYARATGRPGVAFVITGPGLLNALTPLGQSYSDSIPVLAISTCLARADLGMGRGKLHEMKDQEAAAEAVCDWSRTAYDAAAAYALIERAFTEFGSRRPRPKHIQIPIDVLAAPAPEPDLGEAQPLRVDLPVPRQPDVIAAAGLLRRARRPLFVFGGGAVPGAGAARALTGRLGAAAFTTYAGRGILGDAAPLNFGAYLANPDSATVFARADLLVVIGSDLAEVDLWRDHPGHSCPAILVNIDPAVLARSGNGDLRILGDGAEFLHALGAALEGQKAATDWTAAEVTEARARWRADAAAERPGIAPVADALRAALPPLTRVFSDMTQFAYCAKEIWDLSEPRLWHHPFGFGTLGYALPAAIGGKIGLPDQPVVAIAGDYGFGYTLQELGVAVELGLSLPILLWDNGKLGEIEASMIRAQIAPNAVVARNPDFLMLARAYGAAAAEPATLAALQAEVLAALARPGPTLIRMTPALTG
jgi:acetolactate synthase-1/2/3 large subunit/5-guanidino-2-oxopentanoate decarboxylase